MNQTPEQALKLLEEVTGQLNGTRQTHAAIAQAIQTLREAIKQPAALVKKAN